MRTLTRKGTNRHRIKNIGSSYRFPIVRFSEYMNKCDFLCEYSRRQPAP